MPIMASPTAMSAAAAEAKRRRMRLVWIALGAAALYFFVLKK